MRKPDGIGEWDGYPSVSVPADRKPLSKEEEERIGAELRENIRELLRTSKIRKETLTDEQRKIG